MRPRPSEGQLSLGEAPGSFLRILEAWSQHTEPRPPQVGAGGPERGTLGAAAPPPRSCCSWGRAAAVAGGEQAERPEQPGSGPTPAGVCWGPGSALLSVPRAVSAQWRQTMGRAPGAGGLLAPAVPGGGAGGECGLWNSPECGLNPPPSHFHGLG